MAKGSYDKYIFISLLIAGAILSFLLVQPFLKSLAGALVIAYIFYPVYKWLLKRMKKKFITALTTVLIILLVISVPVALVLSSMLQEANSTISYVRSRFPEGGFGLRCDDTEEDNICKFIDTLDTRMPYLDLKENIRTAAIKLIDRLSGWIYDAILGLSTGILGTFIMFFTIFFLFMDCDRFLTFIKRFLNLRRQHESDITKTLQDTIFAVVHGSLIIGLIQGLVAGVGYWLIADVNNPLLWAAVTAFFALIPSIGTGIVWSPISFFLIIMGLILKDYESLTRGILLGVYGFFIVSTIDNILKPKIIGSRAGVHPVIVLLGVFGGLHLMGILGLVLGPVILAVFITLLKIYVKERNSD